MKNILWISTGGTISCRNTENGLAPDNSEKAMKSMLDVIYPNGCPYNVSFADILNIDSTELSCDDISLIADTAAKGVSEFDGIVITHGTDTMAYTAAMLSYMLVNLPIPVIITGSQLPFFAEGTDGKTNLKNAFSAASDCRITGVKLLFGSHIISGRLAHKAYTESFDAFISAGGYDGEISSVGNIIYNVSEEHPKEFIYKPDFTEKVMAIKLTPSLDCRILDYAESSGVKGIVIEGYGTGGVPKRFCEKLKPLTEKGIRAVFVSQCMYESVDSGVYAVGQYAAECGVEYHGRMTAEAACAMLMTELA